MANRPDPEIDLGGVWLVVAIAAWAAAVLFIALTIAAVRWLLS